MFGGHFERTDWADLAVVLNSINDECQSIKFCQIAFRNGNLLIVSVFTVCSFFSFFLFIVVVYFLNLLFLAFRFVGCFDHFDWVTEEWALLLIDNIVMLL